MSDRENIIEKTRIPHSRSTRSSRKHYNSFRRKEIKSYGVKIGRVKMVYTGNDGCIRGATVKVSSNGKRVVLRKSLPKMLPLEVRDPTDLDERDVTKASEQKGDNQQSEELDLVIGC